MGKYIIDVGDAYVRHGLERTLVIPVRINEHEDHWMDTRIPVTPYTEPDMEKVREEAYRQGYDTGYGTKVNEFYEQGLVDAEEGKATCQYCEYQYLDDTEEPCKKCCKAYMNKYKPKAKEQQIQVGDEVRNIKNGWTAVVSKIDGECMTLMGTTGALGDGYDVNWFTKTGRHFPEIAAVLEKMRGGQDG